MMTNETKKIEIETGLSIPDSQLAKEVTEFISDTATELLFHASKQ